MPVINDGDSDAEDEHVNGEGIERVKLPKEDEGIKKMKSPVLPSQEEVDAHYIRGHLPYRDWCPVCVKAQGCESAHRKESQGDRCLPEYSFDYCFPGDEFGFKWVVLVGKERGSRSFMATSLPSKGGMRQICHGLLPGVY